MGFTFVSVYARPSGSGINWIFFVSLQELTTVHGNFEGQRLYTVVIRLSATVKLAPSCGLMGNRLYVCEKED